MYSRYKSAWLRSPEVVEQLARQPKSKTASPPPLEEWTPELRTLTDIKDELAQLKYVSAHADPASAQLSLRPVLPHELRRIEIRRAEKQTLGANFN